MNDRNPLNLAQLQGLLDIRDRVGGDLTIDEAINLLQEDASLDAQLTKELQDDWSKHRYPDKKIKFAPVSMYNLAPQLHSVSTEAQALLLLMIRLQAQKTGYIAVKKGFFINALHLGDKRGRRLNQYITELIDIDAIRPIHIPPRGSKAPAIYQINDNISRIGEYTPSSLKSSSSEIYSRTTECITVRTDKGEKQLVCGTLEEIILDKKAGLNATNIEPGDNTEDKSSLCSNLNCNSNITKNQDYDYKAPEIPFSFS